MNTCNVNATNELLCVASVSMVTVNNSRVSYQSYQTTLVFCLLGDSRAAEMTCCALETFELASCRTPLLTHSPNLPQNNLSDE